MGDELAANYGMNDPRTLMKSQELDMVLNQYDKLKKVDPEVKEKIEKLFEESGLPTQESFLLHMSELFELEQLKSLGSYTKDIEQLEYHTSSKLKLFMVMLQTGQNPEQLHWDRYDEKRSLAYILYPDRL
ncbi:aspartyl-phosphate phosphatase Spo0E family protein [Paenibacillus silvae]|nr:aspartyl-phosphate phosphatase Spo0E family protein [Paenibacillus silvae]